jgi:hypothetical protein
MFETNVFINCPFDKEYHKLLRPLLFTVIYLGYTPRISSERSDSGESRLQKICELIRVSKYSIHDLSRLQATKKGEFYRLNMPFELGIDYGCRLYGANGLQEKKFLVLEVERYRYMKALSDFSGSDIKCHGNDPRQIVAEVRDWFVETVGLRRIAGPLGIWNRFLDFMLEFYDDRMAEGFAGEDLKMMPVPEFIDYIKEWRKKR